MIRTLLCLYLTVPINLALAATEVPIKVLKNYTLYKVTGNTLDEIEASFDKRVGAEHYRSDYDGQALMNYQFDVDDDTCEISNMVLEVDYTLPQMQLHTSKMALGNEYKEFMTQLYRHETIHCAITLEALHQIRQISSQANLDCDSRIDRIKFIEDTIQGIHDEFDRTTKHGWQHQNSSLGEPHFMRECRITLDPIIEVQ